MSVHQKNTSVLTCPQCGASLRRGDTACQYCGAQLTPSHPSVQSDKMKFCKYCGGRIPMDAVVCTLCGRQVEQLKQAAPAQTVIIQNNVSQARTAPLKKPLNKWVSLLLCFFFGILGIHKFYEGRVTLGIIYLCSCGLMGIGVLVDLITLLFKPNPYYV